MTVCCTYTTVYTLAKYILIQMVTFDWHVIPQLRKQNAHRAITFSDFIAGYWSLSTVH